MMTPKTRLALLLSAAWPTTQSTAYESNTLTGKPSADTAINAYQDGSLTSATYALPRELTMAENDTLFITDTDALAIRRANLAADEVTTFATGVNSWGLEYRFGLIYSTDRGNQPRVVSIDANGNITLVAGGTAGCNDGFGSFATFRRPGGMTFVPSEQNFYIADSDCREVRRMTPNGNVTTLVGSSIGSQTADGPPNVAGFREPVDVVFGNGHIYVNDDNRIRVVDMRAGNVVTTLAGSQVSATNDGVGTSASFIQLNGIAFFKRQGVGMVASVDDTAHTIRLVDTDTAEVTTLAGSGQPGLQDGLSPLFNLPYGIDATTDGNIIYVADRGNQRVAMLTLTNVTEEIVDEKVVEDETTLIVAIVVPISVILILGFLGLGWVLHRRRRRRGKRSQPSKGSMHSACSNRTSIFGSVPLHDPSEVKVLNKLGEGHFGTTYRAKLKDRLVALKIPKHQSLFSTDDVRELNALMSLRTHPNLLEFLGVVSIEGKVCVVTAFYKKGSLDKLHRKIDMVRERRFLRIVRDVASGLKALHDQSMIHRDLACRNFLMKSNGVVVIADYGLTQKVDLNKDYYIQHTSTLPWAWTAPESLRTRRFTTKSDIYSTGVALWEILAKGKYPYGRPNISIVETHPAKLIATGILKLRIPEESKASEVSKEIVRSCLAFEPDARPSASLLLKKLEALGYTPVLSVDGVHVKVNEANKHDVSSPSAGGGGYQEPIEMPVDADTVRTDADTVRTDAATYGRRANESSDLRARPIEEVVDEEEGKAVYTKHSQAEGFRANTA